MRRIRLNEAQLRRLVRGVLSEEIGFMDRMKSKLQGAIGMSRDGRGLGHESAYRKAQLVANSIADFIEKHKGVTGFRDELKPLPGGSNDLSPRQWRGGAGGAFRDMHWPKLSKALSDGYVDYMDMTGFERTWSELKPEKFDDKMVDHYSNAAKWTPFDLYSILSKRAMKSNNLGLFRSGVLFLYKDVINLRLMILDAGVSERDLENFVEKVLSSVS